MTTLITAGRNKPRPYSISRNADVETSRKNENGFWFSPDLKDWRTSNNKKRNERRNKPSHN